MGPPLRPKSTQGSPGVLGKFSFCPSALLESRRPRRPGEERWPDAREPFSFQGGAADTAHGSPRFTGFGPGFPTLGPRRSAGQIAFPALSPPGAPPQSLGSAPRRSVCRRSRRLLLFARRRGSSTWGGPVAYFAPSALGGVLGKFCFCPLRPLEPRFTPWVAPVAAGVRARARSSSSAVLAATRCA